MRVSTRRGVTIAEVLAVTGLVGVLVGISLITIGGARRRGEQARCLLAARQASVGVIGYAFSHAEAFPLGVVKSGPARWDDLESGVTLVGPGGVFFAGASGPGYLAGVTWSWAWALRQGEDGAAWADERTVSCPSAARFENHSGRYLMSASLFLRPELLHGDVAAWTDDAARVQRFSAVRTPSRKALLVESASFHSPGFDPWWSAHVGGVTVGAVDGAVEWRDRDALTPGRLLAWDGFPMGTEAIRRDLGALHYTPDRVLGMDW
jgi:hypothetical protein